MPNKKTDDVVSIASKHLGTTDGYKSYANVDNSLLVAVPRKLSRAESNITVTDFEGYDVWNAFEFSALRNDGFPVIARLKIVYSAHSECIVESKSLKLFLHSFNFAKLGSTSQAVITAVQHMVGQALSDLLKTDVTVGVFTIADTRPRSPVNNLPFTDIDEFAEHRGNLETANLSKHNSGILKTREGNGAQFFTTNSMRSNCRVTHQPDWATAFIAIDGDKKVEEESLLRYILSLREEDHFHEEACELLFNDLYKVYKPTWLAVVCLYTRRGGIDINPVRYIGKDIADGDFNRAASLHKQYFRQ